AGISASAAPGDRPARRPRLHQLPPGAHTIRGVLGQSCGNDARGARVTASRFHAIIEHVSDTQTPLQTLTGIVERVTYHNPENGYTVAKLKAPREMDLVTVVGNFAQINAGESLRLRGHWATHPKHGAQFKALFSDVVAPATVVGLEKYLG